MEGLNFNVFQQELMYVFGLQLLLVSGTCNLQTSLNRDNEVGC